MYKTDRLPSLFLFFLLLFLPGCAEDAPGRLGGTAIVAGTHSVSGGERLPGALLLVQGRLQIAEEGTLGGPLYMLSGDLVVDGAVEGDLNLLGGEVVLGPAARVAGDVNQGGGELAVDPGATIDGALVEGTAGMTLPGLEPVERSPLEAVLRFLLEPLLLALGGYLLARFFPAPVERVADAALAQPVASLAFGLLVLIVIPALLIMIAFTMILLPLALLGMVVGVLIVGYGWVAVGGRLGQWLGRQLSRSLSYPAATFLGTLLFMYGIQALEWIPVAGFALFLLALALGVGAVLLTRFGWRRFEPRPGTLPPADVYDGA